MKRFRRERGRVREDKMKNEKEKEEENSRIVMREARSGG